MKLILFGTFLLFTHSLGEDNYVFPEKQDRKLYDVHHLVLDLAEKAETLKRIEETKDFLISSDVENKIMSLNILDILPFLINNMGNITSSNCFKDLSYIKDSIDLKNIQNSWALKMLDSFGKPESGILEGNIKWLGNFDECRSIYAPKKENQSDVGGFSGQYCTLGATVMKLLPLSIGICLPDTCSPSDVKEMISNSGLIPILVLQTGIDFNVTSLTCKAKSLEISNGGIATLFVMSVILFLVLLGSSITAFKYVTDPETTGNVSTNYETTADDASKSSVNGFLEEPAEGSEIKLRVLIDKCDPFLNCFCIFTNGSKLLNTDSTEGQLLCLHGIRFLSMTWVILCHVCSAQTGVIKSLKSILPLVDNLPFQAIFNGWYSVDSFFVLSGFLMSYLYFQECAKRKGKTSWLYFYVHRYLRLTPVYMMVLAFFATVLRLTGSGPTWPDTNVDEGCQRGWWWNLIYLNNILQDPQKNNQCMGWSWYLANDMQFFVISPLFLITLWRWPKVGFLNLFLFLWVNWISGFLITYQNDYIAGAIGDPRKFVIDPTYMKRWDDYMQNIYIKPYTRIAPYVIGIGLGYILFKRRETGVKSDRRTLLIGWLLAVPAGLYCVYGLYHQTPSLVAASFYNAFSRTVYGLSLSWLIFVCLSGQGGVLDKILSYKLFIPLSRLTYCAYLIHPLFITVYLNSVRSTILLTHQVWIIVYLGFLVVTYAFSFLVSLIFESPLIRLEKLVRSKFQAR